MDDNKYFFHALVIEILYTGCYKVDIIYGHRLGFILATLEDVDQTGSLNLFVLNAPFLYPLKTENFSHVYALCLFPLRTSENKRFGVCWPDCFS